MQWRRVAGRYEYQQLFLDERKATLKYSMHSQYPYKSDWQEFRILVPNCQAVVRKSADQRLPLPDNILLLKRLWDRCFLNHDPFAPTAERQCGLCDGWDESGLRTCAVCLQTLHIDCCKKVFRSVVE
jgi:hypothetical protein